jgi:2-succinyl-6-hydroxy-2,4-cyclohexadiene-1-carboxylate synthase
VTAVYLHGFAGSPSNWDGIGVGRAIALPGHGGGDVLATWDDNLEAIGARLDGCRVVVGYSLGARVALGLVATGRVDRAILVGVNPGLVDPAERAARRERDARWAALLRTRGIAAFVDAWQAQPLFATQARVPAELLAERRSRRLALDPDQLARSLEAMGLAEMPDYRAAVAPDRCALIVGALDESYLAIARALPAPLEVISDSGHDPTLEQPAALAEAIARLM